MEKKKLGYGLIGLGNIGRLHLMALRNFPLWNPLPNLKINLAGLFSTNAQENLLFSKDIGFETIKSDLLEFLDTPGLDVVDICTPNHLHKEQVLAAANKGKHIYCEKPLALNSGEAEKMVAEVEKNNLHHQLPFVLRFLPSIAKTRSILSSGKLGEIYRVKAELLHSGYLDPSRPFAWRLKKKSSGGGALADLGSHLIDLLLFLFDDLRITKAETKTLITQRIDKKGNFQRVDVDDWAHLSLLIPEGISASLEVSRLAVGKEGFRISIFGSQGALHLNDSNPLSPSFFDHKGVELNPDEFSGDINNDLFKAFYPPPKLSGGWLLDTHTASVAWFFNCISRDQKYEETPDFNSGLRVQKLLDQAYQFAEKS